MARMRARGGTPSKHRVATVRDDEVGSLLGAQPDTDLESYLAALSPDAADRSGLGRFGGAQVVQLRLPAERVEQLRALAEERGVAPTTLAMDWVLERLDAATRPAVPPPAPAELTDPFLDGARRPRWGRHHRPGTAD